MFGWGTTHILITLPPVCRMKGERLRDGRRKGKGIEGIREGKKKEEKEDKKRKERTRTRNRIEK